jgi:AraC family transcriptional regulator
MMWNGPDGMATYRRNELGGAIIESSGETGWRSVFLERRRWQPGFHDLESGPSEATRFVLAQGHQHLVEIFENGRWRLFDVQPGSMGITGSGEVDRLRWRSAHSTQALSLYLPDTILASARQSLRKPGGSLPAVSWHAIFRDPAILGVVAALVDGMRSHAPELYAEQAIHWLAMHLLLKHNGADPDDLRREILPDRRLDRVIALIRSRLSEPLSLDELSTTAHISKFHFSRLFRERTGLSPHAFLVAERMTLARDLLGNSDLSIAEIARQTGYAQAPHFAVAFRKANGMSPSQYRERLWRDATS